jgi:hypothetical protein
MTSPHDIATRILERVGAGALLRILTRELTASELASVLLAVHQERSAALTWPKVLEQYERTGLFAAATADIRALRLVDDALFALASAFEPVELAPVSPFGLNACAGIDQNNVLTALRASEVLADPTTHKALISAARRRKHREVEVRLCGTHRLVRMQSIPNVPGYARHFRIFTMTTAGRDQGDERFEVAALFEHARVYLELFRRLESEGYVFGDRKVSISDTRDRGDLSRVERGVFEPLSAHFPEVQVGFDATRTQGRNYYDGYCLKIETRAVDGAMLPLGDGGFSTWTQSMLSDKKERFFASAIGTELIVKRALSSRPSAVR